MASASKTKQNTKLVVSWNIKKLVEKHFFDNLLIKNFLSRCDEGILSSEASNLTSPLDKAVSKVEPEFEVLEKQEKLSSSQDNVSDALLIRYVYQICFVCHN